MIQLKFSREEGVASTKNELIATVDASALPRHSLARNGQCRSGHLGLDKDAHFAHGSVLWRAFSSIRTALGPGSAS